MPDLAGRTVVVTGASSGIGAVIADRLAQHGARVILAVRSIKKGERVAANMDGDVVVRELDLARLASVRRFARDWSGDLDILINNAGIMLVPERRTEDGFESQTATNYLGPFALTNLLLPQIRRRVVNTSSQLHRRGHVHLDDLDGVGREYDALQAYRDSKLAVVLFTIELQRRLDEVGSAVKAITSHPGIARTSLNDHVGGLNGLLSALFMRVFNDTARGALPALYAATADVPGGSYVGPGSFGHFRGYPTVHRPGRVARRAGVADTARKLWEVSAELTGTGSTLQLAPAE